MGVLKPRRDWGRCFGTSELVPLRNKRNTFCACHSERSEESRYFSSEYGDASPALRDQHDGQKVSFKIKAAELKNNSALQPFRNTDNTCRV